MKSLVKIVGVLLLVVGGFAQTLPPTFIKGNLDITYYSRQNPGKVDMADVYNLNLNISNSAIFKGTIKHLPLVMGSVYGVSQNSSMEFNIDCDIINPSNLTQTKRTARVYGKVPITQEGVYQFDPPLLIIGRVDRGTEGKFGGVVQGKPLTRKKGWFEALQQEALTLTKGSKGKFSVKKYDKMVFISHKIPVGPIDMYPEMTVSGDIVYDYDRSVWFFNNLIITYYFNNIQKVDKLTGNVRWVESPNRKTTGEGEYQFDIKVNEKPPSEASLFNQTELDEAALFAVDTSTPGLNGTMKYKDTMSNGTVVASKVQVDLVGNQLSKQTIMNVFKLLFFTTIVPLNNE